MTERRYDSAQPLPPPFAAWTWTLNWNEINPSIVIGSCPMSTEDIDLIRLGTHVTALFSVQHDACLEHFGIDYAVHARHGRDTGLEMVRYPIKDFDPSELRKHLPGAVRVLADLLRSGHRTYVHCTAGMGRSPLTVMAYLVFVEGWVPDDAMEMLRRRRSCIAPDWDSYFACRRELSERYRGQIERRAWEVHQSGRFADPGADWRHAEAEILRSAILEEKAITL